MLEIRTRDRSPLLISLTSRQIQVLRFLCDGLTLKEAGLKLGISYNTARAHVLNVMRRTKARSRDQLMAMAGASGLYRSNKKDL